MPLLFFPKQNLIYVAVPVEASSDKEDAEADDKLVKGEGQSTHHDSSSDDNDSTAAAHAAATGHSPHAIKTAVAAAAAASIPAAPEALTEPDAAKVSADIVAKGDEGAKAADEKLSEAAKPKEDKEEDASTPVSTDHAASNSLPTSDHKTAADTLPNGAAPMDVEETGGAADGTAETGALEKTVASPPIITKMEVNSDINLNERDEDENCAIHIAIHARKLEHVKILLEAGASFRMRSDGSLPIHTAVSIGSLAAHRQFAYECVVLLSEHGADLSVKDDAVHTPLFLACKFNLPQIASYILSDEEGLETLNTRADRAGNRPLHAAAKYDTLDNPSLSKSTGSLSTGHGRAVPHHHPDGSVVNAMHHIPGVADPAAPAPNADEAVSAPTHSTEALLTQVLLGTNGIEVDAVNVSGQTPLHVACMRRNWPVARLLLHAGANPTVVDKRGFTPGQLAYKRGMPIPNDLVGTLGDPPEKGIIAPVRELIVDPDGSTLLFCHELCTLHRTCPPINRDSAEPPPENVRRLHVLVDPETGILRSGEFGSLTWKGEARRAAIGDVLKASACLVW